MTEAIIDRKKRPNKDRFIDQVLEPGLYLVATPIGNLRDITLRALDVLANADLILAEDTRHSKRLLDRYDIQTPMQPYHEHNGQTARPGILSALAEGKSIALISDAGTPLISDPGFKLVRAVGEADFDVIPIPGPSSVLAAISCSGLPSDRFLFAGFTPPKQQARQTFFAEFTHQNASLIFFESPKRLLASLRDMYHVFGPRQITLARELTKIHETVLRKSLPDLIEHIAAKPVRGECVLVLGPPQQQQSLSPDQIDHALSAAMQQMGIKAAAREVAEMSGRKVRDLYARALALKMKQT